MSETIDKDKGGGQSDTSSTPSSTSTNDNAKTSKETSPPRSSRSTSAIPQLARSRKSSQEFSPTRNNALSSPLSTIPSAAAVQRALSAQRPNLPPGSVDGTTDAARNERSTFRPGTSSPAWPTSPRLKSPPPLASVNKAQAIKKNDNESTPSNTSSKRLATVSSPDTVSVMQTPDQPSTQASRTSARGASAQTNILETVDEGSAPSTPSVLPARSPAPSASFDGSLFDGAETASLASMTKDGDGSGDGDIKNNTVKVDNPKKSSNTNANQAPSRLAKRSLTNLSSTKPKPAEPPRTMTVETEPVTSMPQLLGGDRGASGRDGNGSVRTKPSAETIRPKKEKKKSTRKAASLHSGTATSKADLFEAKVASAVDEADTDDSDETFVYESNPPDPHARRHHTRTPSGTSLANQDHGRNRHGIRSGSHAIGGKKSMKFSNSTYNNQLEDDDAEGRGSTRAASTPRPHHIGRHGKAAHPSILDANSPFTQASRTNSPRGANGNFARSSRPNSPRLLNGRLSSSPKKGDTLDVYDDAADDERTPLMGSVRVTRSRHSKRPNGSSLRNSGYYGEDEDEASFCSRFGGCCLLGLIVLVLCVAVATFVVGLNQPLLSVKVRHLQNVLATEQELMLDMHVDAINTNIFAITVSDLDVNVFAESAFVGTPSEWRSGQRNLRWAKRQGASEDVGYEFHWPWEPVSPNDGVDEGTDPIDEPEPGMQKMLLGRVLEFDSPLVFDASPIRRARSTSIGEIQLAQPGNQTEVGGSDRWERVLQHPFDLIVRGVVKYQLPLSSKTRSVKIASRAKVKPESDEEGKESSRDYEFLM